MPKISFNADYSVDLDNLLANYEKRFQLIFAGAPEIVIASMIFASVDLSGKVISYPTHVNLNLSWIDNQIETA